MRASDHSEDVRIAATDKLFGLALLAFAVVALGAYSFAAGGDQPTPSPAHQVSSSEIRTTPDNAGQRDMPAPVAQDRTD